MSYFVPPPRITHHAPALPRNRATSHARSHGPTPHRIRPFHHFVNITQRVFRLTQEYGSCNVRPVSIQLRPPIKKKRFTFPWFPVRWHMMTARAVRPRSHDDSVIRKPLPIRPQLPHPVFQFGRKLPFGHRDQLARTPCHDFEKGGLGNANTFPDQTNLAGILDATDTRDGIANIHELPTPHCCLQRTIHGPRHHSALKTNSLAMLALPQYVRGLAQYSRLRHHDLHARGLRRNDMLEHLTRENAGPIPSHQQPRSALSTPRQIANADRTGHPDDIHPDLPRRQGNQCSATLCSAANVLIFFPHGIPFV